LVAKRRLGAKATFTTYVGACTSIARRHAGSFAWAIVGDFRRRFWSPAPARRKAIHAKAMARTHSQGGESQKRERRTNTKRCLLGVRQYWPSTIAHSPQLSKQGLNARTAASLSAKTGCICVGSFSAASCVRSGQPGSGRSVLNALSSATFSVGRGAAPILSVSCCAA